MENCTERVCGGDDITIPVMIVSGSPLQTAVQQAGEGCPHSMSEPVLTVSQVHSMLQTTIASVKSDVRQMVSYIKNFCI